MNGQCNNLGKCHCEPLFDPYQNCSQFGSGGSVDGGPSLDPSGSVIYNLTNQQQIFNDFIFQLI
jgi:hypothetical protein